MTRAWQPIPNDNGDNRQVCTFIASGDLLSDALELSQFPDKTVSCAGATLNGKTVTMQGSDDGINWYTLLDLDGTSIQFTALNQNFLIKQNPAFIQASLNDATGVNFSIYITSAK